LTTITVLQLSHLRRSLFLKSLIFPQQLLQDSSGTTYRQHACNLGLSISDPALGSRGRRPALWSIWSD